MALPTLHLVRDRTGEPALDTAVARSLLLRVAAGELPETFRLTVPGRIVAFGRQDQVRDGFTTAAAAAVDAGFVPIRRLAGGRAAVFHEGTLAFSWAVPDARPAETIHPRFRALATVMVDALRLLGVDARIGEVPGEYCPGTYSVNARGARKLMGVGQRLTRTAAHVGGVLVAADAGLVVRALEPVYAALGYEWDPDVTGAVADEVPGVGTADVADAVVAALGRRHRIVETILDPDTVALAQTLATDHVVEIPGAEPTRR
ncbi:MAG: lipoate--protein ligase family protein [Acidimicrobiia bacterium]|nr:lipoate--protein ligase family protein [Acidimicrobiia bacterium]